MYDNQDGDEELIALIHDTCDEMEGDPELIETMRELWILNVQLRRDRQFMGISATLH